MLALSASAALAVHPIDGATYKGKTGTGCGAFAHCTAVFRVARNGQTMSFLGTTDFAVGCPGGGGDFRISSLASEQQSGTLAPPTLHIHPNGSVYGARTATTAAGSTSYHLSGRFIASGKKMVFKWFDGDCSSAQYTVAT